MGEALTSRNENGGPAEIARATGVSLRTDVSGRAVTTVSVGGALRALFEPDSIAQVAALVRCFGVHGVPYHVLGAGSNLLIDDAGVVRPVVRLGRGLREVRQLGRGELEVGAGAALMTLARTASSAGYAGLEFAGGIPASLGGAVRMNAGAHGGQMADVVVAVTCVLPTGEVVELPASDLNFRYRSAALPLGAIVVGARLRLVEGDRTAIEGRRAEFLARRKATQPLTVPSFGSVFKNPPGDRSAGAVLEGVGMKGAHRGGAAVSELHANWIINPDRTATAQDVIELIEACREAAKRGSSIDLEPEVVRWLLEP